MKILKIIILLCNIIILIPTIHFGFFALFPFLKKSKKRDITTINHKFLILIAARNEEVVIGNLIDSIQRQNYPKAHYKICVIPNNCTDKTSYVAKNKKCLVLDIDFKPKTKGEVLNYAFKYFKKDKSFDTYLIFDADNVLDCNFLNEMNNSLNEGYNIVQGLRDTKNLYDNCISGSYGLFFHLQNLFLYESRNRLGESIAVNGTGYAVSKEFIDKTNYQAKTSTEDIELSCICALKGEKIGFSKKAVFYDEQVTNFKISMKQRKRWIQGNMQVWKNYKKYLFSRIKNNISFHLIDEFHILTLPIIQAFALIVILLSYLFIVPIPLIIIGIIVSYIGEVLVCLFLTLFYKKKVFKSLSAILFFPIFHISWYPIYVYSIFKTNNVWEEIKHTKAVDIDEILEKQEGL